MAQTDIVARLALDNSNFMKNLNLSQEQMEAFKNKASRAGKAGSGLAKLFKSVTGISGGFAAAAAGIGLVGAGLSRAVNLATEFEVKMSEMRSLTGLGTEDLNALAAAAQNMGSKYGMAAAQIVDTMKNIGGALPELLQFKEGLMSVTEWVVTLSKASGLSMEEATTSFTTALNQFGAGAEMAGTYANTLAAAAQAGSAEIPYLAKALERAGGVASSLGMSFEDTVAIIETIAPKFSSAEEAGTALKNMLLGMEKAGGKVAISTNGFTSAIESYLKKQPSATKMMKDFGKSGMQAGLAIQANISELSRYQNEITGTNAATEQAHINSNNLRGSLDVLASTWDNFTLSVNKSNGLLKKFVDLATSALDNLTLLIDGKEGRREKARRKGAQEGVTAAGDRVAELMREGKTREKAIDIAIGEAEASKKKHEAQLKAVKDAPKNGWDYANYAVEGANAMSIIARGDVINGAMTAARLTRMPSKTEANRVGIESKIAKDDSMLTTLRGMLAKPTSTDKPKTVPTDDDDKKKGKKTDPLENSREMLAAAGFDVKDLTAKMKAAKKLEGQINELKEAVKATADPALRAELQKTLDALLDPYLKAEDEHQMRERLDELKRQFAKAMPDLPAFEIEGMAQAALDAERLDERIKGVEASLKSTTDPVVRQHLQRLLDTLRAPILDAEDTRKIQQRLGELKRQFSKAMPDLPPLEIEGLARAALDAERLDERIKGVENALAATTSPEMRKRLRETLKELTALRDSEVLAGGVRKQKMDTTAFRAQLRAEGKRIEKEMKARDMRKALTPRNEWRERRNEALGKGTALATIGFGADIAGTSNNLVSALGSAFSSLGLGEVGEAISQGTSVISSLIGVVTAATEVINMIQGLTAAAAIPNEIANTTALTSNSGFLAANTAALISLNSTMGMGNLLSFVPGFAEGGVVGGSSFTGDRLLARVNSGERILTRRQQENLGRALVSHSHDAPTAQQQATAMRIEVGGGYTVRGEDLYVALKNYTRRTGRTL